MPAQEYNLAFGRNFVYALCKLYPVHGFHLNIQHRNVNGVVILRYGVYQIIRACEKAKLRRGKPVKAAYLRRSMAAVQGVVIANGYVQHPASSACGSLCASAGTCIVSAALNTPPFAPVMNVPLY